MVVILPLAIGTILFFCVLQHTKYPENIFPKHISINVIITEGNHFLLGQLDSTMKSFS